MPTITVSTTVNAPIDTVWNSWTAPEHITQWCQASNDWHAPHAENDLRVGGKFLTTMAAKDGSVSFDFEGSYTEVIPNEKIVYEILDGREVVITFETAVDGILITETFVAEGLNDLEMQKSGWQAILENFRTYTESL